MPELKANMLSVIKLIRSQPLFASSWILFCPESAPPMVPEMLHSIIMDGGFEKVVVAVHGNKEGTKIGCLKDGITTASMCFTFKGELCCGAFKRWRNCIYETNSAIDLVYKGMSRKTAVKSYLDSVLREQLLGFKASPDELSKKPVGMQNDLAIAVIMSAFWIHIISNSKHPAYKNIPMNMDSINTNLLAGLKRKTEFDLDEETAKKQKV
jgi:hypothetical protein